MGQVVRNRRDDEPDHSFVMQWFYLGIAFALAAGMGALTFWAGASLLNLFGWHALKGSAHLFQIGAIGGSILFSFPTVKAVFDTVARFHGFENGRDLGQIATGMLKGAGILSLFVGLVGAACLGVSSSAELGFAMVGALLGMSALILGVTLAREVKAFCAPPLRIYPPHVPTPKPLTERKNTTNELGRDQPSVLQTLGDGEKEDFVYDHVPGRQQHRRSYPHS